MLQQGQLTPGLTQHCSVQPTPCSPFPLSEGMGASSYPHAFVKHSAPYTRAEHHRSQLQPIPALLLGHRGSKSGHKEAWGSPSTCPTLTPIPHSHPSHAHTRPTHSHPTRTPWASRLWLLHHRGCTEQPALGHGAPSARRERGHPHLLLPSRAHLTGMRHSRKSRVATLRQSSTPWLCSHFSTAMSVAGEGCTTSRSCSTLRYFPAGTTGSTRGAERGEAGGVGGRGGGRTVVTVLRGARLGHGADEAGQTRGAALPERQGQLHVVLGAHAAGEDPSGGRAAGGP